MGVEIRRANASDIEGMSEVVDSAWHENYKDIFSPERIAQYTGASRRESFSKLLERGVDILVLTMDDEIAALCAFQMTVEFPDCAEIMLLYVHPKYQRRGFGGRLLTHVLNGLRRDGYARAVLDTAEKNEGARIFYEKHGFVLQKQYENGISYITYLKKL